MDMVLCMELHRLLLIANAEMELVTIKQRNVVYLVLIVGELIQ
jgi:hypothetical protein